jgi:ligand-binding SRPBCC domain-containing protein
VNITISTIVQGNYKTVISKFDKQLFEALAPKNATMHIKQFTGSSKGDVVHIQFVKPFKADWISDIIEDGINDKEAYFIDKGRVIPFGIATWQHKHIVRHVTSTTCEIVDDITYTGVNFLWTLLLYPGLYFGFYPRKNIYKKYFNTFTQ